MEKEAVLKHVEETLRAIPGVMDVWMLDAQDRTHLESIEREAESHGACGGLMPFVNRGVWATMSRQVVAVIVIGSSIPLIGDQFNIVYIEGQNKEVIGEYLTPERAGGVQGPDGRVPYRAPISSSTATVRWWASLTSSCPSWSSISWTPSRK